MNRFSLLLLLSTLLSLPSFAQRPIHKELTKKRAFAHIPEGPFELKGCDEGMSVEHLPDFYISSIEITNGQYREFLEATRPDGDTAAWFALHPVAENWNLLMYCEPMMKFYGSHPAYDDYPVVNVSLEGARAYCAWYGSQLQQLYPEYEISCRLPQANEWMKAASGHESWEAVYPFGPFLRNSKGIYLHNFKTKDTLDFPSNDKRDSGEPQGTTPTELTVYLNDGGMYTTASKSYFPNGYGLYNSSGNVSEMLENGLLAGGDWNSYAYDIRICSFKPYTQPEPTAGFRPVISVRAKTVSR